MTPYMLILKLSQDNENPARSDFTLSIEKSPLGQHPANREGEESSGYFSPPGIPEQRQYCGLGESSQYRNRSRDEIPDLSGLKVTRDLVRAFFDIGHIDDFSARLFEGRQRHRPRHQRDDLICSIG
jgi:hypothetical protein